MFYKRTKRGIALLLAALLLFSEPVAVYADTVSGNDVMGEKQYEEHSLEEGELSTGEEITEEISVSDNETVEPLEDVSENAVAVSDNGETESTEEEADALTEAAVSENEQGENSIEKQNETVPATDVSTGEMTTVYTDSQNLMDGSEPYVVGVEFDDEYGIPLFNKDFEQLPIGTIFYRCPLKYTMSNETVVYGLAYDDDKYWKSLGTYSYSLVDARKESTISYEDAYSAGGEYYLYCDNVKDELDFYVKIKIVSDIQIDTITLDEEYTVGSNEQFVPTDGGTTSSHAFSTGLSMYSLELEENKTYRIEPVQNGGNQYFSIFRKNENSYQFVTGSTSGAFVYNCEASGTYYLRVEVNRYGAEVASDMTFTVSEALKITNLEYVSNPIRNTVLYGFTGYSDYYLMHGAKVKITYSDGSTKTLDRSRFYAEGVTYEIRTSDTNEYANSKYNGGPWDCGTYKLNIRVGGYDKIISREVTVLDYKENAQGLQINAAPIPVGNDFATVTEYTYTQKVAKEGKCYYAEMEAGKNYRVNVSNEMYYSILDEEGNVLVSEREARGTYDFTPEKAGKYYIVVNNYDDYTRISVSDAKQIKGIRVLSNPTTKAFMFGVQQAYPAGVCVEVTYADNTKSTYSYSDYEAWSSSGLNYEIIDTAGKKVSAYRLAPGTYYFRVYYVTKPEVSTKTAAITVTPFKYEKELSLGESASLSPSTQNGHFIKVSLESGKKYRMQSSEYINYDIYDSSYNSGNWQSGKDTFFAVDKTGTYYLDIFNSQKCSVTINEAEGVSSIEISRMPWRVIYNKGETTDPTYGMEITVEYTNGEKEVLSGGLVYTIKNSSGVSVTNLECAEAPGKYTVEVLALRTLTDEVLSFEIEYGDVIEAGYGTTYSVSANNETVENDYGYMTDTQPYAVYAVPVEAGDVLLVKTAGTGFFRTSYEYKYTLGYYQDYDYDTRTYRVLDGASNVGTSTTFTADSDGTVYISLKTDNNNEITITKAKKITKAEIVVSGNNEYMYGEEFPYPREVKIDYEYSNGDSASIIYTDESYETSLQSDGIRYMRYLEVTKNGKKIKQDAQWDANGLFAPGNYFFGFEIPGYDKIVYTPFKVTKAPVNYKIVFHAGIEGVKDKTQGMTANKALALSANTFKKPGYTFIGWTEDNEQCVYPYGEDIPDTAKIYSDKEKVINLSSDGGTVDLYAVWQENKYTLYANLAGGDFKPACGLQAEYYGSTDEPIILPTEDAFEDQTGYHFSGWYTSTNYKASEKITEIDTTKKKDYTIYAKWNADTYTVAFDANGENGTTKSVTAYYGASITLPASSFKSKKAFLGWSLTDPNEWTETESPESYVDYQNKGAFNITELVNESVGRINNGDTVTLYAVWKDSFDVAYELDFGSIDADDPLYVTEYTYGKSSKLPTPKKDGYTFLGWYSDAEYQTKVSSITAKTSGDITLYAKWTPVVYNIKFDVNGGKGKVASQTMYFDESQSLNSGMGLTKPGYYFGGWTTDKTSALQQCKMMTFDDYCAFKSSGYFVEDNENYSVNEYAASNGYKKGTLTFYAVWVETEYIVTFEAYDGVISGNDEKNAMYKYDAKKSSIDLPTASEVTKAGYTFDGWYSDENLKKKVTGMKGLYGNITLYAKWTAKYTVIYDANGGTAKTPMKEAEFTFNTPKALAKNAYTYKDSDGDAYAFVGWSTVPAGDVLFVNSEKIVTPEITWNDEYVDAKGNTGRFELKLYAKWEKDFEIAYEENGGTMPADYVSTYSYGNEATNLPTPLRAGYKFEGWYSDATLKKAVKSISKTSAGDITLYAKWTGLKYTIEFDANIPEDAKQTGKTGKESMVYGTLKALTKSSVKANGYTFAGWSRAAQNAYPERTDIDQLITDGVVKYTDSEKITGVGSYKSSYTLYAVWVKDEYTITFNNNGIGEAHAPVYYTVSEAPSLPVPEKLGYTFCGWYTDKNCKKKAPAMKDGITGNMTLYAKWTLNK